MKQVPNEVGLQLIPAVAYGDAAGLPTENSTAAQIAEKFGRVTTLLPPSNRFHYRGKRAGTWSDDTQLTLAVASSLIESDGFDLANQAEHLIETYDTTPLVAVHGDGTAMLPLGWGFRTSASVRRLKDGVPPTESGEPGGDTNGVLMKLSPLAFWHIARNTAEEQRYAELDALTRMTHDSDAAAICSRVHADVLAQCFNQTGRPPRQWLAAFAISRAKYHEDTLSAEALLSRDLDYLQRDDKLTTEDVLAGTDGAGYSATQTLATAYGIFICSQTFPGRVYDAVNIGGDTDSRASIVGAMTLFQNRSVELPPDADKLQDIGYLKHVSAELTVVALM